MELNLICFVCLFLGVHAQLKYKLCVYPNDMSQCDNLSRGGSAVDCIPVQDSVDCALKIETGVADFGVFYPEQALVVASKTGNINVIGEVRAPEHQTEVHSFQTVVVVRDTYTGGIEGLRGRKYCHPGFMYDELWTLRVRKEFEYVALAKGGSNRECDQKSTLAEREICLLANFFGDSCRPGPWTTDDELNKQLRKKYSKLCRLCDAPNTCSYNNVDATEPQIQSLKCLSDRDADVAFTSMNAAIRFGDKDNYRLLCRDGHTAPIQSNVSVQCVWRNQPWTLLLGNKNKAIKIRADLKEWIDSQHQVIINNVSSSSSSSGSRTILTKPAEHWKTVLQDILTQHDANRLFLNYLLEQNNNSNSLSTIEFLRTNNHGLWINVVETDLGLKMKWCTVSEEEHMKCEWLARASLYAGIKPNVDCIQGEHVYDCMDKIKNRKADIIAIDSNYGYLARNNSLANLLYDDERGDDSSSIIALISQSSEITKFSDLKEKKACFPEYSGLAWISFVEYSKHIKLISDDCEYGKSLNDLFDSVCAPGAHDTVYHPKLRNAVDSDKLCTLCGTNCAANELNPFYGSIGAFRCIEQNGADVAFLNKRDLQQIKNGNEINQNYKVLCKDETLKSLLEADETCALSVTVDSEVVCRRDDPRKLDYQLALLMMEQYFGTSYRNEQVMEMFKKFNNTDNLLFKKSVLGFDDESTDNIYVKNYIDLFKNVDKCTSAAAATAATIMAMTAIMMIAFSTITLLSTHIL